MPSKYIRHLLEIIKNNYLWIYIIFKDIFPTIKNNLIYQIERHDLCSWASWNKKKIQNRDFYFN